VDLIKSYGILIGALAAIVGAMAAIVSATMSVIAVNGAGNPTRVQLSAEPQSVEALGLLAGLIPADVRPYCRARRKVIRIETLASIFCQPPGFSGELDGINYDLMPSPGELNRHFVFDSRRGARAPCTGLTHENGRYVTPNGLAGRVHCFIGADGTDDEGWVWVDWTDDRMWVLARAFLHDEPLASLTSWWEQTVAMK
jgi:hypothetical protein